MNKNLVLMFVKEPKLGFVKTRLAKNLGNENTLELYKCFVKDLILTITNTSYDFKLCTYGDEESIKNVFGDFNNFKQKDGDLGIKMKKAFEEMFLQNYENIVLIGSDTPHITEKIFTETFEVLNKNKLVLGPSEDGGYYLIACNKNFYYKDIFTNISWSTDEVLTQTLQKVNKDEVYLLKYLNDIDVIEDLNDFYQEFKNSFFKNSNTISYIKENNLCKNLM